VCLLREPQPIGNPLAMDLTFFGILAVGRAVRPYVREGPTVFLAEAQATIKRSKSA
jgi:hypothetical protein